jgi:integrase
LHFRGLVERYEVGDGGCPGLRVAVFPSKKKSYILRFRYRGLQRKLTLGPCLTERGLVETVTTPELDTPLSLASARQLATTALREAKAGADPCVEKQRKRQQALAGESDTLESTTAEYLRREGGRLRSLKQRTSDRDLLCSKLGKLPALGKLPVAEIGRGLYTRALDFIADERGPVRADRVLSAAKSLLNWHAGRGDYVPVLVRGGKRTSTTERARDWVLTDDELRAIWRAAGEDQTLFGPYVKFVLLTAVRRDEARKMTRGELSDGGATWTIPGSRYKSKKDVVIPLSEAAQAIIASMPDRGEFVFTAGGRRPFGNIGKHKERLDAASGVTGWRLHDLRRTARTLLSRAGISADHAERCLGHAITGVRGVYDRFEFLDEKRHAFEALAAQIARIIDPPADDVVVQISEKARRK